MFYFLMQLFFKGCENFFRDKQFILMRIFDEYQHIHRSHETIFEIKKAQKHLTRFRRYFIMEFASIFRVWRDFPFPRSVARSDISYKNKAKRY